MADALLEKLEHDLPLMQPRPKLLILNFPANPTTQCVELSSLNGLLRCARNWGIYIVHDLAYADIVFDGYRAPSVLEVPGAKDIAVEFFTLSKSYNMPGWRVGFMVGNPMLVAALARIKSYFDYGTFTPIQVASIAALEGPQECVGDRRQLQGSAGCAGAGVEQAGLAGGAAEGYDVRVGEDSRAVSGAGVSGVFQEAAAGGKGRGESWRWVWRSWRWACSVLAD